MKRKIVSQREARRLRRRVVELEQKERERLCSWSVDYPGKWVLTIDNLSDYGRGVAKVTAQLGHIMVARYDGERTLRIYAVGVK